MQQPQFETELAQPSATGPSPQSELGHAAAPSEFETNQPIPEEDNQMWGGRSEPQVIVLYKPCYDGIIPMTLRDVYAYGKNGVEDQGWGCTYRVI